MRPLVVLVALLATGSAAPAQATKPHGRSPVDELIPADRDFAEHGQLKAYEIAVRNALLGPDLRVGCQALVFPSFEREWSVHVETEAGRSQVVYSVMKEQLWGAMGRAARAPDRSITPAGELKALAQLSRGADRFAAPVAAPIAQLLSQVWDAMLSRAKKPLRDDFGLDGTSYYVFAWSPRKGHRAGTAWSPERQTPVGELAALVEALREHAQKTGDAVVSSETGLAVRSERLLTRLKKTAVLEQ